jgi:16S rRNA (uracil1498-N3)-methyltransferase
MSPTRLHVDDELASGRRLSLGEAQAHYIARVLRLRPGDTLIVFNGKGGEFDAAVEAIRKDSAVLAIGAHKETSTESTLHVQLVQGISRGERMDFVVQKATELGVKRITPVLTKRGVVRLDARRADTRRAHWQNIAASACEQSGRVRPPLIDGPVPLDAWFGAMSDRADVDLILRPDADLALAAVAAPVTKLCLLIGPEGGFSAAEYEAAAAAGFRAVSLGPRILRTETAATAALAVAQSLWGDLGG